MELVNSSTVCDAAVTGTDGERWNSKGQEVKGSLTAARPLQFHLLHVNLAGRHPNGDWVDDGCVLQVRERGMKSRGEGLRREAFNPPQMLSVISVTAPVYRLVLQLWPLHERKKNQPVRNRHGGHLEFKPNLT